MSLKNKLSIILITYNRLKKLEDTLNSLLGEESPIRDFDITILDNASTDGTSEFLTELCKKYKNINYIRHPINVGGNGNICRAFELGASSGKEYVWVLCDDDKYDFSNWSEVEKAIQSDVDIVCLSDYIFPNQSAKTDPAYQIFQLTFVPAGIYKTALITDTVLTNMYDAIYTMFQQSCLTIHVINKSGNIHVCSKPLVFNGLHFEDKVSDNSYVRGSKSEDCIARRRDQFWITGYVNILSLLKNTELRQRCLEVSIPYKDIYGSWDNFYNCMNNQYLNYKKLNYFYEIYNALSEKRKREFVTRYPKLMHDVLIECGLIGSFRPSSYEWKIMAKHFLKTMFSIDNSRDKKYKIIKILGFRIKIQRKKQPAD